MYMPPELIRTGQVVMPSEKIDIWALGVIAFYLLSYGKFPFPGITKPVVDNKILSYEPDMEEIKFQSPQANEFVLACLKKDPAERINAHELLQLEWFQTADTEEAEKNVGSNALENIEYFIHEPTYRRKILNFISNIIMRTQDIKIFIELFI